MPIYEYLCSSCRHEFEELQRFSDPPVKNCPSCKGRGKVKRKLSQSAFVLKGGGWYSDGYAKSGNGNGSKAAEANPGGGESKAASGDGASSTGKTEKSSGSEGKSESTKSAGSGDKGGKVPAPPSS